MTFKWNEDYDKKFQQIKEYLENPPVLMAPMPGKSLLLYISTTTSSLGALLTQHDAQGHETIIYYIRRILVSYELNYIVIKKAYLAMVFSSQKFRYYMRTQSTQLISKIDPLKYLLRKEILTKQLAKWVMILSEFDITYVDQKEIKG